MLFSDFGSLLNYAFSFPFLFLFINLSITSKVHLYHIREYVSTNVRNGIVVHVLVQPVYSVGTLSARWQNAIEMAFCWRADGELLLDVNLLFSEFGSLLYYAFSFLYNLAKRIPQKYE